jgi:hypothetical protein
VHHGHDDDRVEQAQQPTPYEQYIPEPYKQYAAPTASPSTAVDSDTAAMPAGAVTTDLAARDHHHGHKKHDHTDDDKKHHDDRADMDMMMPSHYAKEERDSTLHLRREEGTIGSQEIVVVRQMNDTSGQEGEHQPHAAQNQDLAEKKHHHHDHQHDDSASDKESPHGHKKVHHHDIRKVVREEIAETMQEREQREQAQQQREQQEQQEQPQQDQHNQPAGMGNGDTGDHDDDDQKQHGHHHSADATVATDSSSLFPSSSPSDFPLSTAVWMNLLVVCFLGLAIVLAWHEKDRLSRWIGKRQR